MTEIAFVLSQLFNGLSVASILLLAAVGLALSYGLMRVINMAHGEFLMLGGYMAYIAYNLIPGPAFMLLALPLAFAATAALGALLEVTIIKRLYGRPQDTLLVTWGISLILQQAARSLFGSTGVEVTAPGALAGAITVDSGTFAGLSIPNVRIFAIVIAVLVIVGLLLIMNKTKMGRYVRAVNQSREMASALGVNSRKVDLFIFSMGSGLAGLAGAVFALVSPVTPTVGQAYIVKAFLVVILGGVGSLAGTTASAILIGSISVLAESFVNVSFAVVLMLVFVISFLQFRPQGLVSIRSRALDED